MRVLVVDDNDDARSLLSLGLERMGFLPTEVACVADALRALSDATFGAVITDWHLEGDTAAAVVEAAGACRVVVVTGDEGVLGRPWPPQIRTYRKPASIRRLAQALREP